MDADPRPARLSLSRVRRPMRWTMTSCAVTNVPLPRRETTSPSVASAATACRTVWRWTSKRSASSLSDESFAPAGTVPCRISARSSSAMSRQAEYPLVDLLCVAMSRRPYRAVAAPGPVAVADPPAAACPVAARVPHLFTCSRPTRRVRAGSRVPSATTFDLSRSADNLEGSRP